MYTLSNVLFLLSLFLFLLVLQQTAEAERSLEHELTCRIPHKDTELTNNVTNSAIVVQSKCNIFQGKWVFDSSYPQYDSSNCPFIDLEFNCKSRPDKLYQKYKWQPFDCNLPRYLSFSFFILLYYHPSPKSNWVRIIDTSRTIFISSNCLCMRPSHRETGPYN